MNTTTQPQQFAAEMTLEQVRAAAQVEQEQLARKSVTLAVLTRSSTELTKVAKDSPELFLNMLAEVQEYEDFREKELTLIQSAVARLFLAGCVE